MQHSSYCNVVVAGVFYWEKGFEKLIYSFNEAAQRSFSFVLIGHQSKRTLEKFYCHVVLFKMWQYQDAAEFMQGKWFHLLKEPYNKYINSLNIYRITFTECLESQEGLSISTNRHHFCIIFCYECIEK